MHPFVERALRGEEPTREELADYFKAFHSSRESATSSYGANLRTEAGASGHELIANAIAPAAANVLDIGCGGGELLSVIHRRLSSIELSGVDICAPEVERARKRLASAPVGVLSEADALALPFEDGSYDAVVSHMVFMLIPEVDAALREVHRVLRSGGMLTFIIGNPVALDDRMRALYGLVNETIRQEHPSFAPFNPADMRIFSEDGVAAMLESAGFTNVRQHQTVLKDLCGPCDVYDRLVQRYYVGSLQQHDLERIERTIHEKIAADFEYAEPIRIVSVTR